MSRDAIVKHFIRRKTAMNTNRRYGFYIALALLAFPLWVNAEILGNYMGYEACIKCHEEIVLGWKTTSHANAFETLKEQGEEKQSIPGCFKCHVVGFEKDGGFVDMALTPELKDVQCENCHGPARKHVESEGNPDLIIGSPNEASCRICHTTGQDKNFDFEKKSQWVHAAKGADGKMGKTQAKAVEILNFSETRVEFGNMVEGDIVKKKVTVTNTGNKTVTLTNLTTSCACTSATLGKRKLHPKESTELEITYYTYKFPGKFAKFVTVFTDIPGKDQYRVDINGFVKAIPMGVLEVQPRKIALGDSLKAGSPLPFTISITNTGDAEMKITKIVSKKRKTLFFDSDRTGELIIKPGNTANIDTEVIYDSKGRMLDYIMIHSNARNVTSKGYKVILTGTFE